MSPNRPPAGANQPRCRVAADRQRDGQAYQSRRAFAQAVR